MEFVGIDRLSLLDYEDYVSVVLFAKPCNFRCPFCHNGLTVLESNEEIKFDEILSYLKTMVGKIDAVVISGGEPTLMDDLEEKIVKIRELGYKIKLDTNGTNPELLEKLVYKGYLDYVAMDIKNCKSKYSITSGVSFLNMNRIEKSIQILIEGGVDYEFRTTLVDEFHNLDSIKEMGQMVKGASKLYLQKFVDREGVITKGLHPVSEDLANQYKQILSEFVKQVNLRGY